MAVIKSSAFERVVAKRIKVIFDRQYEICVQRTVERQPISRCWLKLEPFQSFGHEMHVILNLNS